MIFKSWGTVCLIINPYLNEEKTKAINSAWSNLINLKNNSLLKGQIKPKFNNFCAKNESKSIDTELKLAINLNEQFNDNLSQFDFLLATSNAIKRRDEKTIYPSPKEIVRAMRQANNFEYFLKNRSYSIGTFQDKIIAKILRVKYKVNLKSKRKMDINRKMEIPAKRLPLSPGLTGPTCDCLLVE